MTTAHRSTYKIPLKYEANKLNELGILGISGISVSSYIQGDQV